MLGGVGAQIPSTTEWVAPPPPQIWSTNPAASRDAWLEQKKSFTRPAAPAAETVAIIRLVGETAVPFTPDSQNVGIEVFTGLMPPGGLLSLTGFAEGAPDPTNPDTAALSQPYVDVAAILWQLAPTGPVNASENGATWQTQSQAVMGFGGALQAQGVDVDVKVMALIVSQSNLTEPVFLSRLRVVHALLEVTLDDSAAGAAGLNANQTWALTDGATKFLKGWVASHVQISRSDQSKLGEIYPTEAPPPAGSVFAELEVTAFVCRPENGKQPPPGCEYDTIEQALGLFLNSSAAELAAVGLRSVTVRSVRERPLPPGLEYLNPPAAPAPASGILTATMEDSPAPAPARKLLADAGTPTQAPWVPWHLDMLDQRSLPLDGAFNPNADGTGVNVYLISSGIQADHSEFAPRQSDGSLGPGSRVQGLWGINGIDPETDCIDGALWYSFGTYAASLIAGATVGVAKNATLHSVRMRDTCLLDNRNIWSPGALPSALDAVLSTFQRPGVVAIDTWWSRSRVADDDDDYIETEILSRLERAADLGIPIITAASGGVSLSTPCDNVLSQGSSVITVAGVDPYLQASITGSVNSPCIDMWAPGGGLGAGVTGAAAAGPQNYTTVVPRGFGGAWLVTGIAAQYLQHHPEASPEELRAALVGIATTGRVQGGGPESPNLLAFTDLMAPDGSNAASGAGSRVDGDGDEGISTGAIIGIVIASLAAVAAGLAIFMTVSRRRNQQQTVQTLPLGPDLAKLSPAAQMPLPLPDVGRPPDDPSATKLQKHDWEIEESQIQFVPGPDGAPYWILGRGQSGEVRRALKDGIQAVAVKTLRQDTETMGSLNRGAFAREIAFMQWLSRDANVVQFFGAVVGDKGSMMLVTELMEGGDLRSAMAAGPAATWGWYGRGKGIALDVARGLHFLHSHGVVHRDVKSKNILLARDGRAKLGDVGLAYISLPRSNEEGGSNGGAGKDDGFVGTFAFSAPEMILCGTATPKADMYSFGVVLWEIVAQEVAVRGRLRAPEVPRECPQEVADVLAACLSADPDERPTAREAYEALAPCAPTEERGGGGVAGGDALSLSLPSLASESLPSIAAGGSKGSGSHDTPPEAVNGRVGEAGQDGSAAVVDSTREADATEGSSIMSALGSLTPGLRSVVQQIRRRMAGSDAGGAVADTDGMSAVV